MFVYTWFYDMYDLVLFLIKCIFTLFLLFINFKLSVNKDKQEGDFGWNNRFLIVNSAGISSEREFEVTMYLKFIIV